MQWPRKALKMAAGVVGDGIFGEHLMAHRKSPPARLAMHQINSRVGTNLKNAAISKPCGMSSAQVIRHCQIAFNPSSYFQPSLEAEKTRIRRECRGDQKRLKKAMKKAVHVKIGHGGTLDPLATGVLILGLGSGTKELSQFLHCTKSYETIVLFGASTDSYDRVGRLLNKRPYDHITREKVEAALDSFRGQQMQIPPLFSALKMNGKPLYEYAREGKPIPREIEGRQVEVLELELTDWYEPGKHGFRWPTVEAEAAERNLAEQVWRVKKQQETGKKLTAEEKEEEDQALAAHEAFKRRNEERQDELVKDSPSNSQGAQDRGPMMSGALGKFPEPTYSNKGVGLVPDAPSADTPPPWTDEGPPAAKIRMTVTSGYYVRSFCHDLGTKLGSAGLMAELCRTRQSDFTLGGTNCLEYDDLEKGETVWGPQVADMLSRWNAEPHGGWQPGVEEAKEKTASNNDGNLDQFQRNSMRSSETNKSAESLSAPSKRRRSPSADGLSAEPHRKAAREERQADSNGSPARNSRRRSDDEKSWNGLDD